MVFTSILSDDTNDSHFDHGLFRSQVNAQTMPAIPSADTPHLPNATINMAGRCRQLSGEEWEGLKDVLYKYYIQENKTMNNIIDLMRKEHSIALT